MSSLKSIGKFPGLDRDLANKSYISSLTAVHLSQPTIDSLIAAGFAPYSLYTYVDAQDALNATEAYILAGDATRLHTDQVNVDSGVPQLDSSGRVDIARVTTPSTQQWPKLPWSPAAYNAAPVAATTETTVYTCAVADPGYSYKLMVTGLLDAKSSVDNEYPIVRVRVGSVSGEIVAQGYGCTEHYTGGTSGNYTTAGTYTYSIPADMNIIDCVLLGGGGGGEDGGFFGGGDGGSSGSWAAVRLTKGSNLPVGTTTLTIIVGAGGGREANGGFSRMSGTGVTTLTANGGSAGGMNNQPGGSPGNYSFQGTTYVGGAVSSVEGNAPGGGGGGGPDHNTNGYPGAAGAAWLRSMATDNDNYGVANIIPTSLGSHTPITGATTLYVRLVRSGAASTVTASTLKPALSVMAIPVVT